jgi:biotin carboxyl carrier protein
MGEAVVSDLDEIVAATTEPPPMNERLVVAPCSGRFMPLPPEVFSTEGEWVEPGTVLAQIHSGTQQTGVHSVFRGWVMGMLVVPGQPVRRGDALFWIRGS